MKILLAAAGVFAVCAASTAASAQEWRRDRYPYEMRHHQMCQYKARQLFDYERRAARDGRIDRRERDTIRDLRRDLDRDCGRFRWRG